MFKTVSTTVLLSALLLGSSAMACPGGHLRFLMVDGEAAAEINMSTNEVSVKDVWELVALTWTNQNGVVEPICPTDKISTCDSKQQIGRRLVYEPEGTLEVQIKSGNTEYKFIETGFSMRRGGCADESQPVNP